MKNASYISGVYIGKGEKNTGKRAQIKQGVTLNLGEHVEFNDNTVFHSTETQTERVMLNAVKHPG